MPPKNTQHPVVSICSRDSQMKSIYTSRTALKDFFKWCQAASKLMHFIITFTLRSDFVLNFNFACTLKFHGTVFCLPRNGLIDRWLMGCSSMVQQLVNNDLRIPNLARDDRGIFRIFLVIRFHTIRMIVVSFRNFPNKLLICIYTRRNSNALWNSRIKHSQFIFDFCFLLFALRELRKISENSRIRFDISSRHSSRHSSYERIFFRAEGWERELKMFSFGSTCRDVNWIIPVRVQFLNLITN